jgi:hypothetical protein
MRISSLLLSLAALASLSCSLLYGPAGGPPSVSDYLPKGTLTAAEGIRLDFSEDMDTASVERGFSLLGPAGPVAGTFRWSGARSLRFLPAEIEQPHRYLLEIAEARSAEGIEMEEPFLRYFSSAPELPALEILGCSPGAGETEVSADAEIRLEFSRPVDRESLFRSFSLRPRHTGSFRWSETDTVVEFLSELPLAGGEDYRIEVSSGCTDKTGIALSADFSSPFTTAALEEVRCSSLHIDSLGESFTPAAGELYTIEKDETIKFTLSRALAQEERYGFLTPPYGIDTSLVWNDSGDEISLGFEEDLLWDEVYPVELGTEVFRFICRGEASRPVAVKELLFCNHIEEADPLFVSLIETELLALENSPAAALDIHLSHSARSVLPLPSLLSAFSLNASNGSAYLYIESLQIISAEKGYTVVRLSFAVETGAGSGMLSFRADSQLEDSLGNRMRKDFLLSVNL